MTKYHEMDGALYELVPPRFYGSCEGCVFEKRDDQCGRVTEEVECSDPDGVWKLVGTQEDHQRHRACSHCLHAGKTFAEAPCRQCRGSVEVPVGYAPKWEPRGVLAAKPAGPVTVQLQARESLQEQALIDQLVTGVSVVETRRIPIADILKPEVVSDPKDFGPGKVMFFHSELTAQELGVKPTNPKDLIGVRKVPMSTVPAGVLMDVALALHEGAVKYGRHNYRGVGVRASVYYDAGIGHLMDWWEGDDVDAESGLSHVTKAIASLVVLRDAMLQDKLTDDRPPRSKVFKRDFNQLAGEIIDRHADKSPKHWTIADTESPTKS